MHKFSLFTGFRGTVIENTNCSKEILADTNIFLSKQFIIIITTGRAPSLVGVATTKVRFLGI